MYLLGYCNENQKLQRETKATHFLLAATVGNQAMEISEGRSLPAMMAMVATVDRVMAIPIEINAPLFLYLRTEKYFYKY